MDFPEYLTRAGELLYGYNWRTPLSEDLEVHLRTIYRWLEGAAPRDRAKIEYRIDFLLCQRMHDINSLRVQGSRALPRKENR